MISRPAVELTRVCTGETALMLGSSRNLSRSTIGIVVLLNARNNDEFGGCKRISAPTPSVRLPVSSEIPDVNPTTTRMRITSSATARMLTVVRTGRALRPAMIICLFIRINYSGRKPYKLRALRTLQVETVIGQFLVERRLLKRHFQRVFFKRPLNDDGLRKGFGTFGLVVQVLDVGFESSVFREYLFPRYLHIGPVDPQFLHQLCFGTANVDKTEHIITAAALNGLLQDRLHLRLI